MVKSHYSSFVPLLDQLQENGKFSKAIPVNSSGVKEISDYLFLNWWLASRAIAFRILAIYLTLMARDIERLLFQQCFLPIASMLSAFLWRDLILRYFCNILIRFQECILISFLNVQGMFSIKLRLCIVRCRVNPRYLFLIILILLFTFVDFL